MSLHTFAVIILYPLTSHSTFLLKTNVTNGVTSLNFGERMKINSFFFAKLATFERRGRTYYILIKQRYHHVKALHKNCSRKRFGISLPRYASDATVKLYSIQKHSEPYLRHIPNCVTIQLGRGIHGRCSQ